MLKFLFEWLDSHPASYWAIAAVPTTVLLGWTGRAIVRADERSESRRNDLLFTLVLFAVLLAWRWPFLLSADEYNPDESQLIAGALTLRVDPVPWRGVDGFTSGPLNFYPLLLPRLIGLPLDYFTARCIGLFLVWGALVSCWRLFRSWSDPSFAALLVFPALAFFCTVTDWDFIHYSSEHFPLLLFALGAYHILRRKTTPEDAHRGRMIGCFVAGLLPWAKLQSAPLAATLVIAALVSALRDGPSRPQPARSGFLPALLTAAIPTALALLLIVASGQFEHFWHSYLLQNFSYVNDGSSLAKTISALWKNSRMTNHFPLFLITSLVGVMVGLFTTRRAVSEEARPPVIVPLGLCVISFCCVLTPRRPLLHYVLLSIVPLSLLFGTATIRWTNTLSRRSRLRAAAGLLAVGFVLPFALRVSQPGPEMYGSFATHWREPRTVLAEVIRNGQLPSVSRIAIWGWLPSLYVETGLPQGTRDGNTSWAMMPSPHRQYYIDRFLADLRRNQPELFVDSVGFGSRFFPNRSQAGHESFPALKEYIQTHYKLILDESYARLYAKNELNFFLAERDLAGRHSIAGRDETNLALVPNSISPADLPRLKTRTGYAQILSPPAEIIWALDDKTREVIFEYGFAPEAYRTANRTDGVELIFELRAPGAPVKHLFYRRLDPRNRLADRGPVEARLVLPPLKGGAQLVARTTAGPLGDSNWDWIYLSRVVPVISSQYTAAQFPGFDRVPDRADADLSYRLEEGAENILILHAPASLSYDLTGTERRLHFEFGFQKGAYSNGGQTDGATFLVELHRTGRPPEILFQQHLAPTSNEADRAIQSAEVEIPSGPNSSQLVIRIDPGKSNAWDWTFIPKLQLESAPR